MKTIVFTVTLANGTQQTFTIECSAVTDQFIQQYIARFQQQFQGSKVTWKETTK